MPAVVRLRPTASGVDRYNNATFVWASTPLPGVWLFDPGGSIEPVAVDRAATVTQPTLYAPGWTPDLTEADRVTVDGLPYLIDGKPAAWSYWAGGPAGLVVRLRAETEGA